MAASPPTTAADFVSATSGANQYEVMAAHIALVESRDAAVRAFAQEMIRDHTDADATLRLAATRSGLSPGPAAVGGDQTMLLAALQGLRGKDFDLAYVRQQSLAHRSALAMEGGYARNGADAGLREVAKADVAMIERHLQSLQALQRPAGS